MAPSHGWCEWPEIGTRPGFHLLQDTMPKCIVQLANSRLTAERPIISIRSIFDKQNENKIFLKYNFVLFAILEKLVTIAGVWLDWKTKSWCLFLNLSFSLYTWLHNLPDQTLETNRENVVHFNFFSK